MFVEGRALGSNSVRSSRFVEGRVEGLNSVRSSMFVECRAEVFELRQELIACAGP